VLPGVSHWVQHEAPGIVNGELLAFLGAPHDEATAARPTTP
jgi:pimeloyl-ACP methyl ester carboxylesterase